MRTQLAALATTAAAAALAFGFLPTDVVRAEAVNLSALSLPQLNGRLIELRDEANAVQARAEADGRDSLTDDEQREVDRIFTAFEATEDEIERREASAASTAATQAAAEATPQPRKTAHERLPAQARAANTTQWRDEEGRPVLCLANNQTVSSTVPQAARRPGAAPAPRAGDFLASMIDGQWERRGIDVRNSQSEQVGYDGGYFVGGQISSQVIDLARAASVIINAGAQTIPMSTASLDLVRVSEDPTISPVGENELIPESDARFSTLTLRARKFATRLMLSRELVEDAPNAATEIERLLGVAMASAIDSAALFGVGPTFAGVFAGNGVQDLAVAGTAPNLNWDTFLDALGLIEGVNGKPNAIVYSSKAKRTLAKLKSTTGEYLSVPPDVAALSRLVSNKLPDNRALVGDFRQMYLGVRIGVQFEVSRDAGEAFDHDQVQIKVRWRGDVGLAHPDHFVRLSGIALGT